MSSGDRVPAAARAVLTILLVGITPSLALAQASPDGMAVPPPPAEAPPPDPTTDQQQPRPVTETPRPYPGPPRSEVGVDFGMVARPESGDSLVHYLNGWTVGAHTRVDILEWLGVRLATRFERQDVTFDEGALNLPLGTVFDQPILKRINIGLSLEPQWRPVQRLLLFVGLGVAWGRTTAESMHTSGAERVVLPSRSAVFVEYPLAVGARFEIIQDVLVLNLKGSVSALVDQSGRMLKQFDTPNQDGMVIAVGPFPAMGTSFSLLTGVGILL